MRGGLAGLTEGLSARTPPTYSGGTTRAGSATLGRQAGVIFAGRYCAVTISAPLCTMVSPNTPLPAMSYVPVLKGKMAEFGALESCTSDRIVPLLEILSPATAAPKVRKAWPRNNDVIWIHSLDLGESDNESDFASAIEKLFDELRPDVLALPVLTATEEPVLLAAFARIITVDNRGAVIRVEAEDLLDDASDTRTDLQSTLDALGLKMANVDLVIDCGLVDGSSTVLSAVASQCLGTLSNVGQWRSVVVAFSAFPPSVADFVPKNGVGAIPRTDAGAFALLRRSFNVRGIIFADYTVGVPTYSSVNFSPIPNIRYAYQENWIIHRGFQRKDPSTQYRTLAKQITSSSYYSGPAFSPGDQQIQDVATEASGPGNATTHLRVAISRHVHVVLERLATLGEP